MCGLHRRRNDGLCSRKKREGAIPGMNLQKGGETSEYSKGCYCSPGRENDMCKDTEARHGLAMPDDHGLHYGCRESAERGTTMGEDAGRLQLGRRRNGRGP